MAQALTKMATVGGQVRAHWRDYYELCKPRVVALIVFTAMVGMFLSTSGLVPMHAFVFGSIGIALCAASGAAFNHVVDEKVDARMARTRGRPLPTGHLNRRVALGFAFVIGAVGMADLIWLVNPLTAWLTFASLVGYAVVYTLFLKRATPQNIVIGGAAGAAPPVLGWTAVTGAVHPHALLLFLIIFAWTPPHFWALAIARYRDYAEAEIPMLPVTHGVELTRLHLLLYTILLVVVSLLPFVTGMSGWLYLVGALGLGAGFLGQAIALMVTKDDARYAMPTFGYSIVYLMALFAFLFADHYMPFLGSFFS
ncbi:MAG TPA: heme o synthase [Gammaproteobacteria bacterium]|nr:heme o synthase [Gammaproteobacteria bacterium]